MQFSLDDFWRLASTSQLLSDDECGALAAEFAAMKGSAGQANVPSLAQWLVSRGTLTKYQAAVLAAGRPGPFVFGPFVVVERIERGRLARILRATYEGSQPVLLVFLQQLTNDSRDFRQLTELAEVAAAVKNPHVSRTYRATRQAGQSFIVAESLDGQTLAELVHREQLSVQTACQITFQIALGLVALHAQNLTHGGICPRNIWVDRHGAAKLMQFPLVQPARRLKRLELPLVDYVAPEWTEPNAEPTPLVDIYGLGCVLYELIAGRVPFPGGSEKQKIARHRSEFPQRLDQLNSKVPEELADLVAKMLAKDPLLRCQTANEAAHLLASFAAGPGGRKTPPRVDPQGLTPGYGAWKAPDWQPPPQQGPRPRQPSRPRTSLPAAKPAGSDEKAAAKSTAAAIPSQPVEPRSAAPQQQTKSEPDAQSPPAIVVDVVADQHSTNREEAVDASRPFVVTDTPSGNGSGTPKPNSRQLKYILTGGAIVVLLALLVTAWVLLGGDASNATTKATAAGPSGDPTTARREAPLSSALDNRVAPSNSPTKQIANDDALVEDDGETLWASPTLGKPLDMSFLPSGAQLILAIRPADLLNSPEGPKILASLGPAGSRARSHLQQTLGVNLADVEQLMIGFVPDDSLRPQANYVARLREAVPRDVLLDAWGKPTVGSHAEKEFFHRDGRGYYLPEGKSQRVIVIGPVVMLKQMLELDGQPLLRSGIEDLLRHSDDQRQFNLIFTPSYLLTDGRSLLTGHLDRLHGPLREFLDDSIQGVLLSAHVGDELYIELRAVAPIDRKPVALMDLLKSRWEQIPDRIESHVAALLPQPHGRLVIHRFPRMLQLARDYTRSGVDDGQVVLATYLPATAAHNLLMGAELTLLESSGVRQTTVQATSQPATPITVAEALAKKISLSFPRESLDRAVDVLSRELGVPITIVGGDLQLEGITKNQSLNDVNERDQPASDVLRRILKLANPDGKLVYQIKPDAAGLETISITTRAAVKKRGEPLPPGF